MNGRSRRPARSESTDVLVVGSGPGGALTAALLAEAGHDVMVCEDGPWVDYGEIPPYSLAQMTAQYRNHGLTAAVGRPPIVYERGAARAGARR